MTPATPFDRLRTRLRYLRTQDAGVITSVYLSLTLFDMKLSYFILRLKALLTYIYHRQTKLWLPFSLIFLPWLALCSSPRPPLPASPSTPALRIALLLPTTGELATFGRMMQNGILLAVDDWNSQGGILGHHLETVIYETDCTFESGQQSAQRALNEGVQLIVGPLCSEAAVGAAIVAEPAGAILMAPAGIHPLVTVNAQGQTRQGIFSLSYSRRWQAQAAAAFARDTLKVERVALLSDASDQYTRELATNFATSFSQAGGKITYQTDDQLETLNFPELSTKLQESEVQLLYLPGDEDLANQVTAQLTSPPQLSPRFLGSDAWEAETLDRSLVQGSYFPVHFSSQAEQPSLQRWLEKYQATFATEPSTLAVLGYDALHVLAQALQQAQTTNPALVATTLEEGVFEAVTGPLTFAPDHTPLKPVPFIQVEAGEFKYITSILPEAIDNQGE